MEGTYGLGNLLLIVYSLTDVTPIICANHHGVQEKGGYQTPDKYFLRLNVP